MFPWWVLIWLKRSPLVFLVLSVVMLLYRSSPLQLLLTAGMFF
jgi:hypothetical protein